MIAGAVGAVLAVGVAWWQADLPRVVTQYELQTVADYGRGTRVIVLNTQLLGARIDLGLARSALAASPRDVARIKEVARIEHLISTIKEELATLK